MRNTVSHKLILDGLINRIPYAIFWKDTQFIFRGCNQEFAKQFGFNEPKEVIGKTDCDFPFPPHLREKYRRDDIEVLQGTAKLNYEEEQTQLDGTIKTVWMSKTPLYSKNRVIIGVLGIYTDITECKKKKRALQEAKERESIENITSAKNRILVVEDNQMAAYLITSVLSEMNCIVEVAAEGKTAVQLAEEKKFDLIFMDIGLPDMDGYEVTKRIRLNEMHIPIVALTAHVNEENEKHCIAIGMKAVFVKPLIKEKAKDILNSFIPPYLPKEKSKKIKFPVRTKTFFLPITGEPINLQLGAKKVGGSTEIAKEMIKMLIEAFKKDVPELIEAKNKKEWGKVRSIIYKQCGGSAYCGTPRFYEACSQLEDCIRQGKTEFYENLYQQVFNEMENICNAVKNLKWL